MATNVSAGIKTSSLGLTPKRIRAICNAEVPLTTTTVFLEPVYFDISSSNWSTNFPTDETNVLLIHSLTYFFSLPSKIGSCNGIKFLFFLIA